VAEEALQPAPANFHQVVLGGGPGQSDGPHDAAAPVRLAAEASSVFVRPRSSPEQMRVGVHKAGDHQAAVGVDHRCVGLNLQPPLPPAGRADPDHLAVLAGDGGVFEDAEGALPLRRLAGDQLADVVYDQICLDHPR